MKLQENEQIIHDLRPDTGLLRFWFCIHCIPSSLVGGLAAFTIFTINTAILSAKGEFFSLLDASINAGLIMVATAFTILIIYTSYYNYLHKSYIYYITNKRCIFHGGIFTKIERSIPYHKITDIETSQNIIERLFKISKVNVYSAGVGGQNPEISFIGLKDNETPAITINEMLRKFRATSEENT